LFKQYVETWQFIIIFEKKENSKEFFLINISPNGKKFATKKMLGRRGAS
jgi:hypothetical protein